MKRIILLIAVLATFALSQTAQAVSCTGNFTGRGRETLTFTPVGFLDNYSVEDGVPDIYKISGKYAGSIYYNGFYLSPAGVCDVDGDGRDELAFITSGMNGCWAALVVLDYYQGKWNYLTTEGISVYTCDDVSLNRLISAGKSKSNFYARTWSMGSYEIGSKNKLYTISRSPYKPSFKKYYNLQKRLVSL